MTEVEIEKTLGVYLPPAAVSPCAAMLIKNRVHLKITRSRLSKHGDYRAPHRESGHRISINHNLNPYMFLLTFLHEIAHLETYNLYQHKVDAHGKEWKAVFRQVLKPFLDEGIFPGEVIGTLERYLINPKAGSCADPELYKALRIFDVTNHHVLLENLPEGCYFKIRGYKNIFIKGKRLRKFFHCQMQHSKREFRISAVAEVQQVGMF